MAMYNGEFDDFMKDSSSVLTKLNIIVGDEIDAPFDGDNRRQFFDILYKLMMLVNASQCVLISHNSELPQSDCDIILLKNDNSDEGSHPTGNIIWSYYN
jgi:ABC-type molybdenum transport system ATPase subunit/photorepair protein PhrA